MKQTFLLVALSLIIFSCNSKQKLLVPQQQKSVGGLYLRKEGGADVASVIELTQRTDTAGKIKTDVSYWRREFSAVLDSVTKKPLRDSLGNPLTKMDWVKISPDSLELNFSGKDLDSLCRAKWPMAFSAKP